MVVSDPVDDHLSFVFSIAYLDSLDELLGENGAKVIHKIANLKLPEDRQAAKNLSLAFDDFSALQIGLEQVYGDKGSLSIARRAGRMTLEKMLDSPDLTPKPEEGTFESLNQLIDFLNQTLGDVRIMVSTIETELGIILDPCPECRNRESEHPLCNSMLGFLEAALSNVQSAQYSSVIEKGCQGTGKPHCEFLIS